MNCLNLNSEAWMNDWGMNVLIQSFNHTFIPLRNGINSFAKFNLCTDFN